MEEYIRLIKLKITECQDKIKTCGDYFTETWYNGMINGLYHTMNLLENNNKEN
jgi:hypothetical protein